MNKKILISVIGASATIIASIVGAKIGKNMEQNNNQSQIINQESANNNPINIINTIENNNSLESNENSGDKNEIIAKKLPEKEAEADRTLDEADMEDVMLLDTNILYDGKNYVIYKDSNKESFNVGGITYSLGFEIKNNGSIPGYVLLNLRGEYASISFNVGRIDGTEDKDAAIDVFLDEELYETLEISATAPSTPIEIDLNYAQSMKMDLHVEGLTWTSYGFTDIYLKK